MSAWHEGRAANYQKTDQQIQMLNQWWKRKTRGGGIEGTKLGVAERQHLANQVGMPLKILENWLSNSRKKAKQVMEAGPPAGSGSGPGRTRPPGPKTAATKLLDTGCRASPVAQAFCAASGGDFETKLAALKSSFDCGLLGRDAGADGPEWSTGPTGAIKRPCGQQTVYAEKQQIVDAMVGGTTQTVNRCQPAARQSSAVAPSRPAGQKPCKSCATDAVKGNYGYCLSHRTPRARQQRPAPAVRRPVERATPVPVILPVSSLPSIVSYRAAAAADPTTEVRRYTCLQFLCRGACSCLTLGRADTPLRLQEVAASMCATIEAVEDVAAVVQDLVKQVLRQAKGGSKNAREPVAPCADAFKGLPPAVAAAYASAAAAGVEVTPEGRAAMANLIRANAQRSGTGKPGPRPTKETSRVREKRPRKLPAKQRTGAAFRAAWRAKATMDHVLCGFPASGTPSHVAALCY